MRSYSVDKKMLYIGITIYLYVFAISFGVNIPNSNALITLIPPAEGDGFLCEVYLNRSATGVPSPEKIQAILPNETILCPTVNFPPIGNSISVSQKFSAFFGDIIDTPVSLQNESVGSFILHGKAGLKLLKEFDLNTLTPEIDIQIRIGSDDGFYIAMGNQFIGNCSDRGFAWSSFDLSFESEGVYLLDFVYSANGSGSSGLELQWNTGVSNGWQVIPKIYAVDAERISDSSPVIKFVPDRYMENVSYQESLYLDKFWGNEEFLLLINAPDNMHIDTNSGLITWTNPVARLEPYTITVRATNEYGYDEKSWKLTICEPVSGDLITTDDHQYDGKNLLVRGKQIRIQGNHNFNSIAIQKDDSGTPGVVLIDNDPNQMAGSLSVNYLSVDEGCSITANGKGYASQQGPGAGVAGTSRIYGGSGASHGGAGGSAGSLAALTYGDPLDPNTPGSGGGSFEDQAGGAGGGVIRISCQELILNGVISSNGLDSAGQYSGGGAGGSVVVSATTLSGTGHFEAKGGSGRCGGGGGRIAIRYENAAEFTGFTTTTASGGTGFRVGQKGTSCFIAQTADQKKMEIYELFRLPAMQTGGMYEADAMTLHANAKLETSGIARLKIELLEIASGASITAAGQGYPAGEGPGKGADNAQGAGGGGHGARGGNGAFGAGGGSYDSAFEPALLGSGGGSAADNGKGGKGGGAIWIEAQTLVLNGTIDVSGTGASGLGGGGSGGSVFIHCDALSGKGYCLANGGAGGTTAGGGAGGRIAIAYADASDYSGFTETLASGGTGRSVGGTGTVVFINQSVNKDELNIYQAFELNDGQIGTHPYTLGRLLLHPNAILDWGNARELTVRDLVFETGSVLDVSGLGYVCSDGPGAGDDHAEGAGGAGHGGAGGRGRYADGGIAYGNPGGPTEKGSGGGNSADNTGGWGGGAVKITVADQFTHNGTIIANGLSGQQLGGGGAGGSIWINAASITGAGLFQADGGDGGNIMGGGGAGGRILLKYGVMTDFTGWSNSTAKGGSGRYPGQSGTLTAIATSEIVILDMADAKILAYQKYTSPTPTVVNGKQPVGWSLTDGPAGMTIDSSTGVVTWENPLPLATPYTVTIRATHADLSGYDEESWQLSVNVLPVISPIADSVILFNQAYTGPAPVITNIAEVGTVTWRLMSGPADMTINASTGVVSWAKTRAENSPYTITIRAVSNAGSVDISWQLQVLVPPMIAEIADQAIPAGQLYMSPIPTLTQGTEIQWQLVTAPKDAFIDSYSGQVTWPVPVVSDTPYTFTIKAFNSQGQDEESWMVTVMDVPVINDIPNAAVIEGRNYVGIVPSVSNNAPVTSWRLVDAPAGVLIDSLTGLVSWNDVPYRSAPYKLTIEACNAVGCGQKSWNLTVTLGEPVIADIPNTNIALHQPYTGPQPSLLYGEQDVTWSLVYGPEGMTIDSQTGIVSWTDPQPSGEIVYVTLGATNPMGTDYESWQLLIVESPQVDLISDTTILEGQRYQGIIPQLVNSTYVQWQLVQGPSGMTIDSQTGVVTWNYPVLTGSPYLITIRAVNAAGSVEISWRLTVLPTPPVIKPISNDFYTPAALYVSSQPVLSQGTLPVTWSLQNGPAGVTINSTTGVVSWSGTSGSDSYNITIRAQNTTGYDETTWQLKPLVAPDIVPIGDQNAVTAVAYTGPTPVFVTETKATWTLLSAPEGMVIDSKTGVVSWLSPTKSSAGHEITMRAVNTVGSDTVTWRLYVSAPPRIADIVNQTAAAGSPYIGPVPEILSGMAPITWQLAEGPAGMAIDSATGVISWGNPTFSSQGHKITIKADNADGSDSKTFYLVVLVAPVLEAVADQTILGGQASYVGPIPALTAGSAPLTWELINGPSGMTIDKSTGAVVWYNPTHVGSPFTIAIEVSNPVGRDGVAWQLTVKEPPVIADIPDAQISEGVVYTGPVPQLTSGGPALKWELLSGPMGMVIDPNSGVVLWPKPFASATSHTVTIRVTGVNGYDTESWNLTVPVSYTAVIHTDLETAPAGTPVALYGQAIHKTTQLPVVDSEVTIYVYLKGMSRTLSVKTDSNGQFTKTFQPLSSEAGVYTISAEHPLVTPQKVDDQFVLYGMKTSSNLFSHQVVAGDSITGQISVQNLGDVMLSGIKSTIDPMPEDMTVEIYAPGTLKSGASEKLTYIVRTTTGSVSDRSIPVVLTSTEGAMTSFTLNISPLNRQAILVANPTSLSAGINRGSQKLIQFEIKNTGGGLSQPIAVQLPDLSWMKLATPAAMTPLISRESAYVVLNLTVPDDAILGSYTGNLLIIGGSQPLSVPFKFDVVSAAIGSLKIVAEDELTYYADGAPHLANAYVMVTRHTDGVEVAQGYTNNEGIIQFDNLPEAYYDIVVTAEKHGKFATTTLVEAAQINTIPAFLTYQTVSYKWTVVPTEVEDEYNISIEALFETNVPLPVVTIEPAYVDLTTIGCEKQINFTITNHGLIAAKAAEILYQGNDRYEITPLITNIGDIPAKQSIVVPAIFRDKTCSVPAPVAQIASPADANSVSAPQERKVASLGSNPCIEVQLGVATVVICNVPIKLYAPVAFKVIQDCPSKPPVVPPTCPDGCSCRGTDYYPPIVPSQSIICDECMLKCLKDFLDMALCFVEIPDEIDCAVGCSDCANDPSISSCVDCALGCSGALEKLVPKWCQLTSACAIIRDCFMHCKDFPCTIGEAVEDLWKKRNTLYSASSAVSARSLAPASQNNDPEYNRFMAQYNDALDVLASYGYIFGNTKWLEVDISQSKTLSSWYQEFNLRTREDTCEGKLISDVERAELLQIPYPANLKPNIVNQFIDRWNRTITYEKSGIHSIDDVPAGMSTDFIVRDTLHRLYKTAREANQRAVDGGYENVYNALYQTGNALYQACSKQESGICAQVRIQIDQKMTLTRSAFKATLELQNDGDNPLENIKVQMDIRNASRVSSNDLFGIYPPTVVGMTAVDGTGVLSAHTFGTAEWLLLPTDDAAPKETQSYYVGGTLSYTQNGKLITVPLYPAKIEVLPNPSLHLKYFLEREVYSDDPFTDPQVEPAVPFSLGLMMTNSGAGVAKNVRITSSQPRIVENEKGLLINFKIIGTRVGTQDVAPSLKVNLGDLDPNDTVVAQWLMTSSLQGKFVEYKASYEHVSGLGDNRLSLIDSIEIHEIEHVVRSEYPDDSLPDFLANDIADTDNLPDTLYLSDNSVSPVSAITAADFGMPLITNTTMQVAMTVSQVPSGWCYLRIDDPGQAQYTLVSVVRSDGRVIRVGDNAWLTHKIKRPLGEPAYPYSKLHLLDKDSTGSYTLVFSKEDTSAPVVQEVKVNNLYDASTADYPFSVKWQDNAAIQVSSFSSANIVITGPNDYRQYARFVSVDTASDGTPRIASYAIPAPGGSWEGTDNGIYQILLLPDQVADTSGNFAQTQILGTFAVNIWDNCKPELVSLNLVSSRRVGRTLYEYVYSVSMRNTCPGQIIPGFKYQLISPPSNVQIVTQDVIFPVIQPGQTLTGTGTIQLLVDQTEAFDIYAIASQVIPALICDFNTDGTVDIWDIRQLAELWLTDNALADIAPPPDGDGIVNFRDFEMCASQWLLKNNP